MYLVNLCKKGYYANPEGDLEVVTPLTATQIEEHEN